MALEFTEENFESTALKSDKLSNGRFLGGVVWSLPHGRSSCIEEVSTQHTTEKLLLEK